MLDYLIVGVIIFLGILYWPCLLRWFDHNRRVNEALLRLAESPVEPTDIPIWTGSVVAFRIKFPPIDQTLMQKGEIGICLWYVELLEGRNEAIGTFNARIPAGVTLDDWPPSEMSLCHLFWSGDDLIFRFPKSRKEAGNQLMVVQIFLTYGGKSQRLESYRVEEHYGEREYCIIASPLTESSFPF